ncbi:hypothetical protein BH24ACT5_BH24ACT5_10130 [soil metagenome]
MTTPTTTGTRISADQRPSHPSTGRVAVATISGIHLPATADVVLPEASVDAIVADGPTLWALTDRRELHRIDRHGTELVAVVDDGSATCLGIHDGAIWAGGDDARLWRLHDGRLLPATSFGDAPTRGEWHTPWGGPPAVFSIASGGGVLYVSVHVGGVLRSDDAGKSWVSTIDLHCDVHQVAAGPDGRVWAATGTSGLAESRERGATWQFHTDGLHATYLLAVAVTTDAVLVSSASGHSGRDGALYRFDGDHFARCRDGLPDKLGGAVGPRQLVAVGDDVAVALPGGHIHTSADGGRTWVRLADCPTVTDIAVAEQWG